MSRHLLSQARAHFKRSSAAFSPLLEAQTGTSDCNRRLLHVESAGRAIGYDYLLFWSALGGLLSLQGAYQGFSAHAEPSKQQQLSEPSSRDDKLAAYQRFKHRSGLPKEIVLYQYQVCPFCNKVRAFLDYHNVPYRAVEVNPLTKSQLKWSEYKKVPVVLLDEEAVNDSSLILSRLAPEFDSPSSPPASKGWFWTAKAAVGGPDAAAEEEEMRWRHWVDKRFVQLLTVNIYRTLGESWRTFDYIADHSNFGFAEKQAARVAGSGLMYFISGRLVKRDKIEGDLREALYAAANEWIAALGSRRFMGGESPNLADLSMFGVIRSITGTETFTDLMFNSKISGWYEHMMGVVGSSSQLPS